MTDVLITPEKKQIRRALIAAALTALQNEGWRVGKERNGVRGRVRRITKNGRTLLACIRTSQDCSIAFPRNPKDTKWVTLADVNVVVASAVDDPEKPTFAQVHMFDAKELRDRFDRAYAARREADHVLPVGRGVWLKLYREEASDPVSLVGAGIGLVHPPIARLRLNGHAASDSGGHPAAPPAQTPSPDDTFEPLTISQAKDRLARTLGVDPSSIKITVEA